MHWQKNSCTRGNACRWSHEGPGSCAPGVVLRIAMQDRDDDLDDVYVLDSGTCVDAVGESVPGARREILAQPFVKA